MSRQLKRRRSDRRRVLILPLLAFLLLGASNIYAIHHVSTVSCHDRNEIRADIRNALLGFRHGDPSPETAYFINQFSAKEC